LTKRRLKVSKPRFYHLEQLANIEEHEWWRTVAHHQVHADAFGNALYLDTNGVRHFGAESSAAIASVAIATIGILTEIAARALMILEEYETPKCRHRLERLRYLGHELSLAGMRYADHHGLEEGWLADL